MTSLTSPPVCAGHQAGTQSSPWTLWLPTPGSVPPGLQTFCPLYTNLDPSGDGEPQLGKCLRKTGPSLCLWEFSWLLNDRLIIKGLSPLWGPWEGGPGLDKKGPCAGKHAVLPGGLCFSFCIRVPALTFLGNRL